MDKIDMSPHTSIPEIICTPLLIVSFVQSEGHEELDEIVDDLHPAEDGEAGEDVESPRCRKS